MTPRAGPVAPLAQPAIADGLRALRLTVLVFLALDALSTLLGPSYGVTGLGPSDLLATAQMILSTAAAAATMWYRQRAALVLCAAVALLAVVAGGSGEEPWLLVITAVVVAARTRRRSSALLLVGCYLVFAVAFAAASERRHPGHGWANLALALGLTAAGLLTGLVARRLARARDVRAERMQQLERENEQIRAVERARLADDLQTVVTGGLLAIDDTVAELRTVEGLIDLRAGLREIDTRCRALLDELRALLTVLRRQDGAEAPVRTTAAGPDRRGWLRLLTARHIRMSVTAVCTVLAVRALTEHLGPDLAPGVLVQVLGLLSCAVAVWWPVAGAACAGLALLVSLGTGLDDSWSLLPPSLLCLMGALRTRPRRVWLVAVGLVAYGAVLTLVRPAHVVDRLLGVGYLGFIAIAVGMAARHFLEARRDAERRQAELIRAREQVGTLERTAVARELHDVVAHQLSLSTLLVMSTSASDDPTVLHDALAKVGRSVEAAQHELTVLLHTMRRPATSELRPTALVTPTVVAEAMAHQLVENGYQPALDVDPAADALDPTAQRTLGRIMQEGTTNILRYAPPAARCEYRLAVVDGRVRLSITSPLSPGQRSSALSLGWGLRGARERVHLTDGTFRAGPSRDQWVLSVTLPISPLAHTLAPTTSGADRARQPLRRWTGDEAGRPGPTA